MNIYGHQKVINDLMRIRDFWEKTANLAEVRDFKTVSNICSNFARGENKKIVWHRSQIADLRKNSEVKKENGPK